MSGRAGYFERSITIRTIQPATLMPRYFALIPAAGQSTRMGQAKLLLPLAGEPLIVHTIRAWQGSRVDQVLVVVRQDDAALAAVVRSAKATLVVPKVAP